MGVGSRESVPHIVLSASSAGDDSTAFTSGTEGGVGVDAGDGMGITGIRVLPRHLQP